MKSALKQFGLASLFLAVTGCTVVGEEEYSCPEAEKGLCLNAKTAYEIAEDVESANKLIAAINKPSDANSEDEEYTTSQNEKNAYQHVSPVIGTMSQPLLQPKPVLMPAKVLRVWVNSYEDKTGVLHMPQTSYVEITPRRWSLGANAERQFKTSAPFTVVNAQ